jgi:hypothetical protein
MGSEKRQSGRARRTRGIVAVGAALMVALMAIPAQAVSATDPNDADGRLDLRFLGAQNDEPKRFVTVRVKTEFGFKCGYMSPKTSNRISLLFDDKLDGTIDTTGTFVCRRVGTPHWSLRMGKAGLVAKHPRPRVLVVNVGYELIGGDQVEDHWGVAARSKDETAPKCAYAPCFDRAPNSGMLQVS